MYIMLEEKEKKQSMYISMNRLNKYIVNFTSNKLRG